LGEGTAREARRGRQKFIGTIGNAKRDKPKVTLSRACCSEKRRLKMTTFEWLVMGFGVVIILQLAVIDAKLYRLIFLTENPKYKRELDLTV
jgi:hypothetical protein